MTSKPERRIDASAIRFGDLLQAPRYIGVALVLVWTEIIARYKQSVLGLWLIVIQPLMTTGIFTFVFGQVAGVETGDMNYALFAYAGVVPWVFLQRSLQAGSVSLITYGGILSKIFIPRFIAPMTSVGVGTADLLISIAVFTIITLFFGQYPTISWLLLPIVILYGAFVAASCFLWIAAIAVTYRDVTHLLPYASSFLMYAAPIAYPRSLVPENLQFVYACNPIVGYIEFSRWLLVGGELPLLVPTLISLLICLFAFLGGAMIFARVARTFADRL